MRYMITVMHEVDDEGKVKEGGFKRYAIVDRARNNRVFFSTKDLSNLRTKFKAILGEGEDDFDRESFEKKMQERRMAMSVNKAAAA